MDGQTFVTKLKNLKIPGIKDLDKDDFDWVFMSKENLPLSLFWKWFYSNVSADDILLDQELNEFGKLESSGLVFSTTHLQQIEECVGSVEPDEDEQLKLKLDQPSEKDVDFLQKEFKKLNFRKDQLNLQKLEVEARLGAKRESIQKSRVELEARKRLVSPECYKHTKALQGISQSIQTLTHSLRPFECDLEKARFLSQVKNTQWEREEHLLKETITKYIYKQFQEGVEVIAGLHDSSPYCLLDSGQLDLRFVRGPRQAEYLRNAKELNRINKILEETELESLEEELLRASKEGECLEASSVLQMVRSRPALSLHTLRDQVPPLQESSALVERDLGYLRSSLKGLALEVAQMERLKVVSGHYKVKMQRQEYFLQKHRLVSNSLLQQLPRLDFVKIALDIEKQRLSAILKCSAGVYKKASKECREAECQLSKLGHLRARGVTSTERERSLLESLLAGPGSSSAGHPVNTPPDLPLLVRCQESSVKRSEHALQNVSETKLKNVSELYKSCSLLEEILFGTSNSLGALPVTWIDWRCLERQARLEQGSWEIQLKMIAALKDFEKKKKFLKDNPSVKRDLTKWTVELASALRA